MLKRKSKLDKIGKVKSEDFLTVEELKKYKEKITNITVKDKKNVKILFIDDMGFDTEPLKQLGYLDVDVEFDFKNMNSIEPYDIIFCDINDVAKKIYPNGQGAQLASVIKQNFPDKLVIIFSGQNQRPSFNKYYEYVDEVIDKTASYDSFCEIIDRYIQIQNDPIMYWKNLEMQMLKQNLNKIYIAKVEHYYVSSIINGESYISDLKKDPPRVDVEKVIRFLELIGTAVQIYIAVKN